MSTLPLHRSPLARLALFAALFLAACQVDEAGKIACADNSSCPADYPSCVGASSGVTGHCVAATANSDGGSAQASVSIAGVVGHQPADILSGTVRIEVVGQAASGVLKLELTAGGAELTASADSTPPLWYFDYATSGAGDVQLVATLTPGDPSVQPVTATDTLHVDNNAPVLTLGLPSPAQARPGSLVTVALSSSKPLATVGGQLFLLGATNTQVGAVAILSGTPGTDSQFVLGLSLPSDAASGSYAFVATGSDAAGNSATSAQAPFTVYGPFALSSVSVTSSATEDGFPAGGLNAPIMVNLQLPLTVPLGAGAATFTLTDAAGKERPLLDSVTAASGASAQSLSITDAIAAGDASGLAVITATVTDVAGNQATGSASLLIDTVAPYLLNLAPDLAAGDPNSGVPAGTVHFSGLASESITAATYTILSGGSGSGACTCNGGTCAGGQATAPLVSCAVPIPTVAALTNVVVAVALQDDVGNPSVNASNEASFEAVPLPGASGLTPTAVTITVGTSTNLLPTFTGGTAIVANDQDASVFDVTSGVTFQVAPIKTTTYSLLVTNAVGAVFSPAPTATVTVNAPLSFGVTYVPVAGTPTPGAIDSGTTTGSLTFSIPDLTGFISATLLDAGGNPVVYANGGAVVSSQDLFNAQLANLTGVQIPTTRSTDVRTLNYTLQLTNAGNGHSNFLAPLQVIPQVSLSGSVSLSPAALSGGTTSALTLSLPQFSATTQTVSFTAADGTTLLTAAGNPLTSEALIAASGGTISVLPPTSSSSAAQKSYLFTLLASNAASSASQTTPLNIYPVPVLASGSILVNPGSITGASTPPLTLTLPALSSVPSSASSVSLTVSSGGAPSVVTKSDNSSVGVADLGSSITVNPPSTSAGDNKTFTYTLTVFNAATTPASTVATGTLTVIPQPVLASGNLVVSPANINGGSSAALSLALPALASAAASASAVALTISSGGAPTGLTKADGTAVLLSDLGTSISVNPPATQSTDDLTFTYTLTVSNSAVAPATAAATGTLNVVPLPVLAASTLTLSPALITGATTPTLSTSLPALTSPVATPANAVTFTYDCGAGPSTVKKGGTTPVALGDLGGAAISFPAPASNANDNKVCTYTLTVTNAAGATATAAGTLDIVPLPTLASATFVPSPSAITGGTSAPITIQLPAQTSAAASPANTVAFAVDCGSGSSAVTKSDGSAVTLSDLGSAGGFTVNPPASSATDNKSCTYTLTLSNAVGAQASASGIVNVVAAPTLQSSSLTLSLSVLTGGSATTFTIALPAVTSGAATPADTVGLAVACGGESPSTVNNSSGSAVGLGDLNTTITVNAPSSVSTDDETCTYTLTLSNAAGAATTATGALNIVPVPLLSAATFTPAPAVITGGTTPAIVFTLPTQSSLAASPANTVALAVGCGGGAPVAATKSAGGSIALSDLGAQVSVNAPSTLATDNDSCTYTLTLSNAAGQAATATAVVNVVAVPTLQSSSLTLSIASLTGGSNGTFTLALPKLTSGAATPANTVGLTVACGAGSPSTVTKSNGSSVGLGDLNSNITVNAPSTATTDNDSCTYTLTVSNAASTPASATAAGTLAIVPLPVLSSSSLALSPANINVSTAPSVAITLPTLTSPASAGNALSFTVNCGAGSSSVNKTNGGGGAVTLGDLVNNNPISVTPPNSASAETCTYTLAITNGATTPASASATGALNILAIPVFSGALSIAPNVMLGGTTTAGLLQFSLPSLSAGAASSVALTVALGNGAPTGVSKSGGSAIQPGDLGTTISVDPPATHASDASGIFTYSLTATNAAGGTSAATADQLNSYPPNPQLAADRIGATATLLPNGTVLIAGGGTGLANGVCSGSVATAEIYDPTTGASTATGTNMKVSRCQHTATLVGTKVYLMGGAASTTVDVFDTTNNTFAQTSLPTMSQQRTCHTATAISSGANSGEILVVGGYTPGGTTALNSLELFNPTSKSSTSYSNSTLTTARAEHTATLMGTWLFVIGGTYSTSSIDVIDTTAATSSSTAVTKSTPSGGHHRLGHAAVASGASTILVVGGLTAATPTFVTSGAIQTYTVNTGTGVVSSISTGTNLSTGIARFPALLANSTTGIALAFGGTTALSANGDTGSTGILSINTSTLASTAYTQSLSIARQAEPAVNLAVSGASNLVMLVPGGSTDSSGDVVIGP